MEKHVNEIEKFCYGVCEYCRMKILPDENPVLPPPTPRSVIGDSEKFIGKPEFKNKLFTVILYENQY